ncbi:MAG: hypothetical protein ACPH54_03985 [Candidatus Poseidoniaceae archaeon]
MSRMMNSEVPDMFAVRPDHKGPKTVAILLVLGGIFFAVLAYTDLTNHRTEELSEEQIETQINVPNSQGENLTSEQFQQFHQEVNEQNGYLIRGTSLAVGSVLVIAGGISLYFMKPLGGKLAVAGAVVSLIGGIFGNMIIFDAAEKHLTESLVLTYEVTGYLCGVCTFLCGALALLPLINARAKLAFEEANNVELVHDESE